jgi:3'-5' exoribonuclease
MEQITLAELPSEKDYPIAHLLRVFNMNLKETKTGKKYLAFDAGDKSRELRFCKKWDSSEAEYERLKTQKILFITGKTDLWNDNLSILAESLAVPEDDLPPETFESLTMSTKYNVAEMKKGVWSFIQNMEDSHLKKLGELIVKDETVRERFGTWPAAAGNHHAYRAGLLTHVYRLMIHADKIVDVINDNMYPGSRLQVNKDMVILGCLLHDMFKILEYQEDVSYSPWGGITPHLPMGAIEANRKMDQIEGFPEKLRNAVTHLCLAHHGQWGPTTPKSPESVVMHYLDDMFAKLDPVLEALDDLVSQRTDDSEEFSREKVKSCGGFAWLGASLIKE